MKWLISIKNQFMSLHMKKYYSFVAILFLSVVFMTCDKVEELTDVNFNTTVTTTLTVTAVNTNESTHSIVLDAASDAEIQKYASKIKKYEVTELMVAVQNYSSATTAEIYFNGDLGFGAKNSTQPSTECSISNLNITHVAGTGDFALNNCNSILSDIGELLIVDNAVKIYLKGTFSQAPLTFNLKVTAKVKITANPL
jgi:hypothetical protein